MSNKRLMKLLSDKGGAIARQGSARLLQSDIRQRCCIYDNNANKHKQSLLGI